MPIIKPPPLTEELLSHIHRAERMHDYIQRQLPDKFVLDSDEKTLAIALFSLVEEHHGAILNLLRTGQFDGSALALVRPVIDGAYRAHWIYTCAKPETVKRIRGGEDCYPGLPNMATEVEKKMDTDGLFTTIAPYITALHGYTHGGLEQLGRRFDADGNIRASYSDGVKIEAVNATTGHLTALAIAVCQLLSNTPHDEEPRSKAISDFYIGLYQAT